MCITYDFLDDQRTYHRNMEMVVDNDKASEELEKLRILESNGIVYNIRTTEGEKKYNVVKVTFGEGKLYTYLTNTKVEKGSLVVVSPFGNMTVVRVVDSGSMTKAELEKIMPFKKYKHVEGLVVPA